MGNFDQSTRVALVHDSFTQLGGAERVIEAFHELFPDAPVFTLVLDRKLKEKYKTWDIRTSWLQVLYNFIPRLQYLLPLIPLAVSSLNFEGYDVVISSSSAWAKNIHGPKNTRHICYCHTPTRFLWVDNDYLNNEVPLALRWLVRPIVGLMKKWDYKGAQRVSQFIANSKEVQKRIKQYYNRDSVVVHPFVDTEFWQPSAPKQNYFLLAGRLQAHKNNELIIEIFNELGLPLHVVGTGRQEVYLKSIAKQNIAFLGRVDDSRLRDKYSGAKGFIYPQAEDFGLMPLEAAACGTATLAYAKGGAIETIVPGVTGELFDAHNVNLIKQVILNWDVNKYQEANLQAQAQKFGKDKFKQEIIKFISNENCN